MKLSAGQAGILVAWLIGRALGVGVNFRVKTRFYCDMPLHPHHNNHSATLERLFVASVLFLGVMNRKIKYLMFSMEQPEFFCWYFYQKRLGYTSAIFFLKSTYSRFVLHLVLSPPSLTFKDLL